MAEHAEFLLEIGCEEIPASWLAGVTEQLAKRFEEAAAREHLAPAAVRALSTPRRLVVRADVALRQADREEPIWGPSLKVARDSAGAWSNAATGFARKNGVSVDELKQEPKDPAKPAEINLLYLRRTAGKPTAEVLPGVIASVLRGLAFPKRMSWDAWIEDGKGAFPFGRPIRWLVALLGGDVVPFAIDQLVNGARGPVAVSSGRRSFGHRFLPRGAADRGFEVSGFDNLLTGLRERFVLLDVAERESRIREGLECAGAAAHPQADEWGDLTEYPTVVVGEIPAEFERLPKEVLETVLVHHQKYVPVQSAEGRIVRFAAVINTDAEAEAAIVRGMQRVVVARLRDGAFFYDEDRKRALAARVDDLAGVTFHQGLGTYRDKAERTVKLVEALAGSAAAREAALLAKADLTTSMVREFPELQGVMGGIYLRAEGADADIARAVEWHYHPVSVEAAAPPLAADVGPAFAAVSLADKLDTLAGYFSLGLNPTGSSDPYGLRRAAQGAVRVLLDFWPADAAAPLPTAIAAAVASYEGRAKRPAADVVADLSAFFLERLRSVLHARGFPMDEVDAVLGARDRNPLDDPRECELRLKALHAVRQDAPEDFAALAAAFKRANNLLAQARKEAQDEGVHALTGVLPEEAEFTEEAERELLRSVLATRKQSGGDALNYDQLLRSLSAIRPAVDRFFDEVMVMAEDRAVRRRRLELLNFTVRPFHRVADISRLGGAA